MSPVEEILAAVPFTNGARSRAVLQRIAGRLGEHDLATLKLLLKQMPDPDSAAAGLDRFLDQGELAVSAASSSNYLLHAALTVFSHSNYLGDALIRHPELLAWAMERERFFRPLSAEELRTELGWIPAKADDDQAALTLARFKRMQLLRIALRDLLGAATLAEVTLELSNLADALIEGAHDHLRQQLAARHGRPLSPADSGPIESRFVALAVGKLGGRELNYSSDIDLMYLHTGEGTTSGPIPIPNSELFKQLAARMTNLLSRMTPEGFCYRVDLRLRPEGAAGELVLPLDGAVSYYHGRARDWELQMLIKARPAAGDLRLGRRFLSLIEGRIYHTTTDFTAIEKVSESRDRIQEKLRRGGKSETDVKLARGGIRDIEFLVQCLQRLWGGKDPFVRSGGTLFSLHRLSEKGYLSTPDYARLNAAYQYLRTLEHRLQMLDNRQTHSLPSRQADRDLLERKMHGISYSLSSSTLR